MSLVLCLHMMSIIQSANLFAGERRKGPEQAVMIVIVIVIVIAIMIMMRLYALMQ